MHRVRSSFASKTGKLILLLTNSARLVERKWCVVDKSRDERWLVHVSSGSIFMSSMERIRPMTRSFASMLRGLLLGAALAAPLLAHAADPMATVTILEGDALIYRGLVRVHAAPGVRLTLGDIVETTDAAFMQVELADRTVIQFAPMTRALFSGGAGAQGVPKVDRWMFVMNGWVK